VSARRIDATAGAVAGHVGRGLEQRRARGERVVDGGIAHAAPWAQPIGAQRVDRHGTSSGFGCCDRPQRISRTSAPARHVVGYRHGGTSATQKSVIAGRRSPA
jgi:hypothetical protein